MSDSNRPLNNVERYYEANADAALEAFNRGEYDKADEICHDLLAKAKLPFLWRAQCNLLLASKEDNTSLGFAREALHWYDVLLEEMPGEEYLTKMRREAETLVRHSEGREARAAGAVEGGKVEGDEVEGGKAGEDKVEGDADDEAEGKGNGKGKAKGDEDGEVEGKDEAKEDKPAE